MMVKRRNRKRRSAMNKQWRRRKERKREVRRRGKKEREEFRSRLLAFTRLSTLVLSTSRVMSLGERKK